MIKNIKISWPFDEGLTSYLTRRLASAGIPLLCPNVDDLEIDLSDVDCAISTSILFGGLSVRILRLTIFDNIPMDKIVSKLRLLPEDRFHPEELLIRSRYRTDALHCAGVFTGLLHFGYSGQLSQQTWIQLGISCAQLQSITLSRTCMIAHEDGVARDQGLVTFPSLQKLSLHDCYDGPTLLLVTHASQMPKLVDLHTSFAPHPIMTKDANLDIARHYKRYSPSLETLAIGYHTGYHSLIPEYGPLRELTLLDLSPTIYPKGEDVSAIAQSLPNLVCLTILANLETDVGDDGDAYGVSLETIISLATHCKKLEELALAVDPEDVSLHCPFYYRGPTFTNLTSFTLDPFFTLDISAEGLAHFIRAIAPALSECDPMFLWTIADEEDSKAEYIRGKGFTEEEWDTLFRESFYGGPTPAYDALVNIMLGKPHAPLFDRGTQDGAVSAVVL